MALLHTPQRGHSAPAAPTEVSYTAYSPSPSSLDAFRHRTQRINQWTNQVPQSPGTSVGAKSAVWSDPLGTVAEESSGPAPAQQREQHLHPPTPAGHARPLPQNSPAPSMLRQPPIPLLAQTPECFPQPELSRGEHLSRSPSFHPSASTSSVRYAREAYLNRALELPLDMLTEVAAPNEIYESEPPSKPGRVGTILSRARSSVSLRGAAATATSHPAAVATPSGHDRPRVFSHSPSIAYTRRHSQQSLRSGPDMPHILSKLVVNARAPHTGRSPETRPVAAQSPAPSFEDSKCSSMQTSESGHSFSKTDPVSAALQPQLAAHSLPAGNSVTSTGVTNDGASIPPARAFETFRMDQDPIPTSHLARRTTSRGHVQAPSQMAAARAGVQGRELASTAESTWKPSVGAGQRDPPAKSASVGGQMGTRRVGRASSPPTERIASDQGVVLTPSSVSIDEIHDNGERIAFEVPGRRGKLHVSLAWLPGRARAVQTQSASGPMPPTHGRTAAGRRVSLQVPPNAQQAPSHRRSLSASEAPSHVRPFCPPPHLVHASVPHGAPPTSVPAGHFMPGTAPLQVPGYGLHVGDHVPQSVPGVHPAMGSQMSTAVPLPVVRQVPTAGYSMQSGYAYPSMQMPMQARLGIPLAPWPVHAGHVPHMQAAPLGRPAPASQRPGIGLGLAPGFEQTPSRAVTFPAPSTISPWRRLWPFGKNTHNDPFLICPAVSSKASRFAEPIVMEHMSQKEIDRKRRAQRRDECAKRKSGSAAKVRGESGNNAK